MKLIEDFEEVERTEGRYIFDYALMQFRWQAPTRKKPNQTLATEDVSEED